MEFSSLSRQEHLRQWVVDKSAWSESLSAEARSRGFLGWHERGRLPHCDRPGLTQFVTIRLHDSMPSARIGEWRHLLRIEDESQRRRQIESYLDRGRGECHLRCFSIAEIVEKQLRLYHPTTCELLAWVVMPNHVHVLLRIGSVPLSKIMQRWKSITAVQANRTFGRTGRFWQEEYWDRFMRDAEQAAKAVRYIEANPAKAGLCRDPADWPFSSARFRDPVTRQLVIPLLDP